MPASPGSGSMSARTRNRNLMASGLLKKRAQVFEPVEEVPDVVASSVDAMRMKVVELRVIVIAVEGLLRGPPHENQHRARLDLARRRLAETAERNDPAAVSLDLFRGSSRIGEVLVLVHHVE